jgi:replicative DNA helicase
MKFDLRQCQKTCHSCVRGYIDKHSLRRKDKSGKKKWQLACRGIPNEYIPPNILASLGEDPEISLAMLDPVAWANTFLDWHCIDPDGVQWKRKTEEGTLPPEAELYNEELAKKGKSIFHRPYQAEMLRCSSKYKVFRIGRQAGKTECLCIAMLHAIWCNNGFKVVLIAPYQAQIEMVFGRLNEMIDSNAVLHNSRSRSVKGPNYRIQMYNGSRIVGFTAGTSSKQDAGAARGQPASMLVFDEADMLSQGDIQSTLATIINYKRATVWMSSTPLGKREHFYEACTSPEFKEFHYPSQINPNWDEEKEAFFQNRYTEEQYNHEINANFGEQEEGVYQNKYVQAAQEDYEYGDYPPNPKWTYMIGVDWNDMKVGTTIAVVGFSPALGILRLVDKHIISRGKKTQLSACNKIAELNRHWHPEAIYVDTGYGATQIEVLRDFGGRSVATYGPLHPDSRLRNIVKGYDFGSNIEIRDLFTKQPVKKPAKPFLVENSVRRFESYTFRYPRSDKKYTEALLGYIVDRVTQAGRPVYKQQNESSGDHFIDAVNLALIGFVLETTRFGKPKFEHRISFPPNLGAAIGGDKRTSFGSIAEEHRPKRGRAEPVHADYGMYDPNSMPASNTAQETGNAKIWSWPGFGHDAPRPQARSRKESFVAAHRRVFGGPKRRSNRPSRSKF